MKLALFTWSFSSFKDTDGKHFCSLIEGDNFSLNFLLITCCAGYYTADAKVFNLGHNLHFSQHRHCNLHGKVRANPYNARTVTNDCVKLIG